ncbi:MAG: AAA family ATPase [Armatimonadota bacterium]
MTTGASEQGIAPPLVEHPIADTKQVPAYPSMQTDQQPPSNPFTGGFLTLEALFNLKEPREWLVEGLISRGERGMLFGDPSTGKTLLALELSIALAAGVPTWCGGSFNVGTPRNVIYCTAEGLDGLRKRLYALAEYYRKSGFILPRENLRIVRTEPQLFDTSVSHSFLNFITACKGAGLDAVDLVIVDTLNLAILGADENSNTDASRIIQNIGRLRDELGCAVLLIHHTGKNGLYRGASAYRGNLDFLLEIKSAGQGKGILHCYKLKDAEPFADQVYRLIPCDTPLGTTVHVQWEGVLHREGGQSIFDQVRAFLNDNAGEWFTAENISSSLGIDPKCVWRVMRRVESAIALYEYKLEKPGKRGKGNPAFYRAKVLGTTEETH